MKIRILLIITLIIIGFISCVTATCTDLDNSLINESLQQDIDNIHRDKIGINITSNNLNISLMSDKINKSFNNLISINTNIKSFLTKYNTLKNDKNVLNTSYSNNPEDNLTIDKNKCDVGLFNGTSYNQSQYNRSSKLGLNNNSFVNNVNKELNISKKVNLTNNSIDPKLNNNLINKSSNIHHNTTNLVNLNTDKNKHGIDLFNGTLHNQNQYNKTFKLLGLNHSVNNDSIFINKELNTLKSNSNMCDDSREDNFLINHVPESNNKEYNIMLLIPILLGLLGAIIVYKIKN